jgi:hypothetical protein
MTAYNVWLISLRGAMSNSMAVISRDEAQAISFGIQNGFIPIVQKAGSRKLSPSWPQYH